MQGAAFVLTEPEIKAFDILFDAAKTVSVGTGEKYRLVDPVSRIRHLFVKTTDAQGLVAKLVQRSLMKLAFCRPSSGDGSMAETYDVALDQWPDAAARIEKVAGPPMQDEETVLVQVIERRRVDAERLTAKKAGLEAALAEVVIAIGANDKDLKEAETLLGQTLELREKIGRLTGQTVTQ